MKKATRPKLITDKRKRGPNPRSRSWLYWRKAQSEGFIPMVGMPKNTALFYPRHSREQFTISAPLGTSSELLKTKVGRLIGIRGNDLMRFLKRGKTYYVQVASQEYTKGIRGQQFFKITNGEVINSLNFLAGATPRKREYLKYLNKI